MPPARDSFRDAFDIRLCIIECDEDEPNDKPLPSRLLHESQDGGAGQRCFNNEAAPDIEVYGLTLERFAPGLDRACSGASGRSSRAIASGSITGSCNSSWSVAVSVLLPDPFGPPMTVSVGLGTTTLCIDGARMNRDEFFATVRALVEGSTHPEVETVLQRELDGMAP